MNNNYDIVYILKDGSDTEELKYSMRSLVNFPHGKVFLVGERPDWASDKVITIDRKDYDWHVEQVPYLDAEARWMSACDDPRVSDDFWMFNDDFFIMKPIKNYTTRYNKDGFPTSDTTYSRMMRKTRKLIEHLIPTAIHSYGVHMPMLLNKEKRRAINLFLQWPIKRGQAFSMRTVYGNVYELGGKPVPDCKLITDNFDKWDMLSTSETSFDRDMGSYIKSQFLYPSEYEVANTEDKITAHFIWLGSPLPDKYQKNIDTFRKYYDIKLWTEPLDHMVNKDLFDRARTYALKADILRLEILQRFGGLYCDIDATLVSPLSIKSDLVLMTSPSGYINNGTIYAAAPHHPAIDEAVDKMLDNVLSLHGDVNIWDIAGATYITPIFKKYPHYQYDIASIGRQGAVIRHHNDATWAIGLDKKADKKPLSYWMEVGHD